MTSFFHGFFLALSLIIGLGPQNLFLIQNSVRNSRRFLAFVIFSTGDTLLLLISFAGSSYLVASSKTPQSGGSIMYLLSGAYLFLCGLKSLIVMVRSRSSSAVPSKSSAVNPKALLISAFILTFLNPGALFDMLVVIGGASQFLEGQSKVLFYVGATSVSWIWFGLLTVSGRMLLNFPKVRKSLECTSALLMLLIGIQLIMKISI